MKYAIRVLRKLRTKLRKTLAKKRNRRKLIYGIGIAIIGALCYGWTASHIATNHHYQHVLGQLTSELQTVKTQKHLQAQKRIALEQQLNKKISSLKAKLSQQQDEAASVTGALKSVASVVETPEVSAVSPPNDVVVQNCGDNSFAHYIYMHESGCHTYNPNSSSGACGVGQSWPCSKLAAVCPHFTYSCENSYFTRYAENAYGGWAGAYAFWAVNRYW